MEEQEQPKKSNLEFAMALAQLVILTYSTASAVQGLYRMGNDGMGKAYALYKRKSRNHLKAVS